jgi:hypothetical protein
MRRVCRTQLKQTLQIAVPLVLVALALLGGTVYFLTRPTEVAALTDPGEQAGIPAALPEEYGYTLYTPQGYNAAVQVCGNPRIEDRAVHLYLTNPAFNSCQLRAEVYTVKAAKDSSGKQSFLPDKLLGRTGFIHPGTWVQTLTLDEPLRAAETPIYIKIALRDPESGSSMGSFLVGTTFYK